MGPWPDAQTLRFRAHLQQPLLVAQTASLILLGGHIGGQRFMNQLLLAAVGAEPESLREQPIVQVDIAIGIEIGRKESVGDPDPDPESNFN